MNAARNEVVFVSFAGLHRGREGVLRADAAPVKIQFPPDILASLYRVPGAHPVETAMSDVFTRAEVCRLFGMTESRLKYWDQSGFISPSGMQGQRRCYTFQDLIAIRSARALMEHGVSVRRVRRMLQQLQDDLPRTAHPLSQLRICSDGGGVVVVAGERLFEPESGQTVLDFSVDALQQEIVDKLPDRHARGPQRSACEWYLAGCAFEDDDAAQDMAEAAYLRAIHLDPTLANAYINLGNLRYRQGAPTDARVLYHKAVELDAGSAEAHYNLGFIAFEVGDLRQARECFLKTSFLDPTFADAQFNLGMTLMMLDESSAAKDHFKRYLALESTGQWADIARARLAEI